MKILYISKSSIPSRTANSIHVMKMCQAFADNGHEVVLLDVDCNSVDAPGGRLAHTGTIRAGAGARCAMQGYVHGPACWQRQPAAEGPLPSAL